MDVIVAADTPGQCLSDRGVMDGWRYAWATAAPG